MIKDVKVLQALVNLFSLQMIPVGSGISCAFGAPALSSQGGTGQFDPDRKLGVLEDEFGIKTMESLVERVIQVAKKLNRVNE